MDGGKLTLGYKRDSFVRETVISADKKGTLREDGFVFNIKLPPQSEWAVTFDVAARGRRADIDEDLEKPKKKRTNGHAASESDRDVSAFVAAAPCLVASWEPLIESTSAA